jgi:hypothetical protein
MHRLLVFMGGCALNCSANSKIGGILSVCFGIVKTSGLHPFFIRV